MLDTMRMHQLLLGTFFFFNNSSFRLSLRLKKIKYLELVNSRVRAWLLTYLSPKTILLS